MKKVSWIIVVVFLCFSGLDILPYLLTWVKNGNSFGIDFWISHMEWWASCFQYSSNTTQLFWVFNQSIPIWVIMSLLLQLEEPKYFAGLSSLAFAYSPWATIGLVPYAAYTSLKGKKELKMSVNLFNIAVPILMLVVFGTFYMSGTGGTGYNGLIFSLYTTDKYAYILMMYVLFVFIEFGIYFAVMGMKIKCYKYYWITLLELVVFPLFVIRDYNFVMRASIPALFLVMMYIIKYLTENSDDSKLKARKRVLVLTLCLGMFTPLFEINRTVYMTLKEDNFLQEQVYSIGNIATSDNNTMETIKDQWFVYNYNDTFFFRYLAK
jgi:hypothetical protein